MYSMLAPHTCSAPSVETQMTFTIMLAVLLALAVLLLLPPSPLPVIEAVEVVITVFVLLSAIVTNFHYTGLNAGMNCVEFEIVV